jgi:hypothetical protein
MHSVPKGRLNKGGAQAQEIIRPSLRDLNEFFGLVPNLERLGYSRAIPSGLHPKLRGIGILPASFNRTLGPSFWSLEFEVSLELGVWSLEFFSNPLIRPPKQHRADSLKKKVRQP